MTNLWNDTAFYFTSGLVAGLGGTLVSQPFDTVKVHMQTKRAINFNSRTCMENVAWAYRGATPSFIGYGIEKSLVFGTYSTICNNFQLNEHNTFHTFCAGLCSGLVASITIAPAEQLKIDRQLQIQSKYNARYLYKGLKYTSAREGIGFSIYFTVYNQLSKYFNNKDNDSFKLKILKSGIFGGTSAFCSWIPIFPIDVIKSRIQSGEPFDKIKNELKIARGVNKMYFLYGGYGFGMLRTIPFHATCFMIFETAKSYKPK